MVNDNFVHDSNYKRIYIEQDMDYKKKYKEALERAKKINNEQQAQPFDVMIRVFPELKESEDERIKKELCKAIWTYIPNEEANEYIAWLEKQGEHKQWKPSEEQLKALHDLNLTGELSYTGQLQPLIELYNDLKKLTE